MNNIDEFKNLIKEDHGRFGSYKKLAKASGIGATTLQHWETEIKIAPDILTLQRYASTIEVSVARKAKYFEACGYPVPEEYRLPNGEVKFRGVASDLVMVPLVGNVHAGITTYEEGHVEEYIPTMPIPGYSSDQLVFLEVVGDCMDEAGLPEGSRVLVAVGEFPRSGGIGVFYNEDEYIIRKYVEQGRTHLLLPQSSNPDYQPIVMEGDGWHCFGLVVKSEMVFV